MYQSKKRFSILLSLLLVIVMLTGCGGGAQAPVEQDFAQSSTAPAQDSTSETKKLSVVTTIFPEYDWVRQIAGDNMDNIELTMLLDNGVDLHSYQPTVDDIVRISECDMFLYVGGESDEWVEDALREAVNRDMAVVNLLEVLGDAVKEEEVVEGMQEEDEHDHEDEDEDHNHEEHEHHHEEGEVEYDEHVWLSLKNTAVLCQEIADQLGAIDPANKDAYAVHHVAGREKRRDLSQHHGGQPRRAEAGAAIRRDIKWPSSPVRTCPSATTDGRSCTS